MLHTTFLSSMSTSSGHLRYRITDVPPQPNSPTDLCLKFVTQQKNTESNDQQKNRTYNRMSKVTLKEVVLH